MLLCFHTVYIGCYLSSSNLRLQCRTCINTLCVAASPNAALGRPAYQSSTYRDDVAHKAVDGNANMNAFDGSCAITKPCNKCRPWWAVDLGMAMTVVAILISNRNDGYSRLFYTKRNHMVFYIKTATINHLDTASPKQ